MQIFSDSAALRDYLAPLRRQGRRIGLVPTMGNLHQGHTSLLDRIRPDCDILVATIFVNPLQFGPGEDLETYPRTPGEDQRLLRQHACDVLFMPAVSDMYPAGLDSQTRVTVPGISERWCGAGRPGHFDGVATVVSKLLNLVQPDLACFGQKDYQQLCVIRKLVQDLCFPVEIIAGETCRAASGLALSSRNHYLTPDQQARAAIIHDTLKKTAGLILAGQRDYRHLEAAASGQLDEAGFPPEYFAVCNAQTLAPATVEDVALVILTAVHCGPTRLIDNLTLSLPNQPLG